LPEELRSGEIDAGFLLAVTVESADLCNSVVFTCVHAIMTLVP